MRRNSDSFVVFLLIPLILAAAWACGLLDTPAGNAAEQEDEIPSLLAIDIAHARDSIGACGIWVKGFVIGGDLSQKGMSFKAPFKSASNLVLAPSDTTSSKNDCLSVQLPSGNIRDCINLVDHPDVLGTFLYIKGDIVEAYYGIVGLKNVKDFAVEE